MDADIFYPYIIMAVSAIITTIFINLLKAKQNYLIFYHFYILFVVWSTFLISGILFTMQSVGRGNYFPLYVGSIADGIGILVSENYVNLRASKVSRASRISLCYSAFFLGFFLLAVCYYKLVDQDDTLEIVSFNKIIGICLISVSSVVLVGMIFNGTQQLSRKFYDYKECLDIDTNEASNSKSLFIEKQGIFHMIFTVYMIVTKSFGFVTFNYVFFRLAHRGQKFIFGMSWKLSIIPLFLLLGNLIGALSLRRFSSKAVFTFSGIIILISAILIWIFDAVQNLQGTGIVFLIFYFACGLSYSIPSQHILEITNLKFTEIAQSIGYVTELFLIASVQYQELSKDKITSEKLFLHLIVAVVIIIISVLFVILHMPNTFRKSHVEIRDHILNFRSYLIFKNNFYDLKPL